LILVAIFLYKVFFKIIHNLVFIHFVFIVFGYLHGYLHREIYDSEHVSNLTKEQYPPIVNTIPEEKSKSVKVFAKVSRVGDYKSSGQILVYFKKDDASIKLKYGDELKANLFYKPIENIPNSNFDYRQYLIYKQVYQQAYLKSNEWSLVNRKQGNYFISLAYQYREKCHNVLKSTLQNQEAFAVASALLIGDDDAIPKTIYQAYSD